MRVLIVSWEYPPVVVGGLGRHVAALAPALAARGHEVIVLTRGSAPRTQDETIDGVRVIRAAADGLAIDFATESVLAWAQAFEHSLSRAGLALLATGWRPELVHAHDWLVAQTASTLSAVAGARLISTLHATEFGRQQGWLGQPLQLAIHSLEAWLYARSDAVVLCSRFARDQALQIFGPHDRVRVIGNGIHADWWARQDADGPAPAAGRRPLIAFAGRLVHEKGLQELIKALPALARTYPDIGLAVAGTGPQLAAQQDRARRYGVSERVEWLGHVDDVRLRDLFHAVDAVVVPSLYEPFGLVCLEAQAAGAPVAVAAVGGLAELVQDGVSGRVFRPESPDAIAEAVSRLLGEAAVSARMAGRAREAARADYSWSEVAARTETLYRETLVSGQG
ncbi:glycosyltransferase family 4 protein [Jatrophihabitans telluris]|uniref:Glycosyltransferase family 4 protein n=1 Tax=Jatrophihabitans telluris TaxID=2038343 RepID=A0ABY4R488_9ACTN|nr:glycosyltransferase family 4 protein [Jatrophihabitans telluris]UQX89916.1 glycosyltransferase family 4 protein [Jatrophihabitans telluris]